MRRLLRGSAAWIGLVVLVAWGGGCTTPGDKGVVASYTSPDSDAEFEKGANRPPSPRTVFSLARIYLSQGRDTEAAVMLTRLIRDYPTFLPAYYELAELQMRYQKHAEAMQVLSAGLKVSPRNPILLNNLGMIGRYEESLALYSQVLPPAEAHYNLAVICEARKDAQRASSEFAQAFSMDPSLRSKAQPTASAPSPAAP
jgi:tetratricopeptide (TPR) repeat protein